MFRTFGYLLSLALSLGPLYPLEVPFSRSAREIGTARQVDPLQSAKLIIEQTNEFRREEGIQNVKAESKLTRTARDFARYMAETKNFSHTADGSEPADRVEAQGYEYLIVTENIAYQCRSSGFTSKELADKFVQSWKNSKNHRKNMLHGKVTEIGVAIARNEETGCYYAVQIFARPQ